MILGYALTKDKKMDDLGFNKIAAAVLATALGYMGLQTVSHSALHVTIPDTPAYRIAEPEAPTGGDVVELPFPQADWVSAMDAERGAKVFKKCTSCHNAEEGGVNSTGPNLWNIVGTPAGQHADFKYSSAMSNSGLTWDYETLNGYLEKPTRYLSGTAMNFVGLKKEADRAAVIEYLRQASGNPIARPVAASAEPEMEAEAGDIIDDVIDTVEDGAETIVDGAKDVVETVTDIIDGDKKDDGEQ